MPKCIDVVFTDVETPKRLQNSEDAKRGVVRHTFDVRAASIDSAVLLTLDGPNPRKPNPRKKAAKELKHSLEGSNPATVGAFHLAHSGVRGIVKGFTRITDDTYKATFEVDTGLDREDDGIANGLHTIAVIEEAKADGVIPPEQFITFTLIEKLPTRTLVPYIGEGLNTNIQVSEESIINLAGDFDPFKAAVKGKSFYDDIAWHEGDTGEYDSRDVLSVLNALNSSLYPNGDKDRLPIESYEKQSQAVMNFVRVKDEAKKTGTTDSFTGMIPILPEALYLYDLIRSDADARYNARGVPGKAGNLAIMEARRGKDNKAKQDYWTYPFMSDGLPEVKRGTYRLAKGVTYAILSAFRNYVDFDDRGRAFWVGGFASVEKAWQELGGEMVAAAADASASLNYNPNATGKNRPLWRALHGMVENHRLRAELDRMKADAA